MDGKDDAVSLAPGLKNNDDDDDDDNPPSALGAFCTGITSSRSYKDRPVKQSQTVMTMTKMSDANKQRMFFLVRLNRYPLSILQLQYGMEDASEMVTLSIK
jgi:hypothetical protein